MRQRFYPAVVERGDDGLFAVWFPDFPGAVAAAKTQEEAMSRARDVLTRALQECAERDGASPAPSPVEAIELPEDCDFVAFMAVGATPPNPSERVNVYLPRSLIERVDEVAGDWGMTRSSLFGLAVTRLIAGFETAAALPIRAAKPGL